MKNGLFYITSCVGFYILTACAPPSTTNLNTRTTNLQSTEIPEIISPPEGWVNSIISNSSSQHGDWYVNCIRIDSGEICSVGTPDADRRVFLALRGLKQFVDGRALEEFSFLSATSDRDSFTGNTRVSVEVGQLNIRPRMQPFQDYHITTFERAQAVSFVSAALQSSSGSVTIDGVSSPVSLKGFEPALKEAHTRQGVPFDREALAGGSVSLSRKEAPSNQAALQRQQPAQTLQTNGAGCSRAALDAEAGNFIKAMGNPPSGAGTQARWQLRKFTQLRALYEDMQRRCPSVDLAQAIQFAQYNIDVSDQQLRQMGLN